MPEMRGQAGEDDRWQRKMKALLLEPVYNAARAAGTIEDWRPTELSEQGHGDTFLKVRGGGALTIEEKIVRWPGYEYTAITLETMSCTVPGRERSGWMTTNKARWLLYARVEEDGISARCDAIQFPQLRAWFADQDHERWRLWTSEQINKTECRIVPLDEIRSAVEFHQFTLPTAQIPQMPPFLRVGFVEDDGCHLVHYCAVCGKNALFGHSVSLLKGQLGHWYCREHRPQPAETAPPKPKRPDPPRQEGQLL